MNATYETTVYGATLDEITKAAEARGRAFFGATPFEVVDVTVESEVTSMNGEVQGVTARVTLIEK